MEKIWQRSNLKLGEELKISKQVFIEPLKAMERLTGIYYIGETNAGIMVDCMFKPAFGRRAEDCHYKIMINWGQIYCGDVKVSRANGESIHAKRIKKTFVKGKKSAEEFKH